MREEDSEDKMRSITDGRRLLINGPLQLTVADTIKIGSILIVVGFSWANVNSKIESYIDLSTERHIGIQQAIRHTHTDRERIIQLESDVKSIAERTAAQVISESRVQTERLSSIERRLGVIENKLITHVQTDRTRP